MFVVRDFFPLALIRIAKFLYFSAVHGGGPTKMRKSRKMRKEAQIPSKMRKDVCKFYSEGFAHFTRY